MLKNLKIRPRMIISFAIIIILSIALAVTSIVELRQVAKTTKDMYDIPLKIIDNTWNIRRSLYTARTFTLEAVIETEATKIDAAVKSADDAVQQIDQASANLTTVFSSSGLDDLTKKLGDFSTANAKVSEVRQKVMGFATQNRTEEAMQVYRNEYVSVFEEARQSAIALSDDGEKYAEDFYNTSVKVADAAFLTVIILAVVQVLVAFIIAYLLTSSITRPLQKLKEAAENMAEGHIDIDVDYKSKDEIGNLADAFGSVINILNLLNENMTQVKRWAMGGHILNRAQDDERIKGAYQDIIHGVNGIMDTFVNHFNSIPVGVGIADTANNMLFENKTANAYKSIDKDNKQIQTSDFADEAGKTIGSLIITIDQTTVMEAQRESERQAANVAEQMRIAEKQAEYQSSEVEKLIGALDRLAKGNLDVSVKQAAYDEDTKAIHENFRKIGSSLEDSCSNIRGYIAELEEVLGKVSSKDLNVGITREYLGDFAELKKSINNIVDTLNEVFGEISGATDQVKNGSQQVANSAQTLAQGASEQASAVEEISSTIAEVADQTKNNAENASKANEISLSAKSDAETGSHQMDEMVNAMEAIKEASKGIASIIKVIEDIAFQTNILALNAAVEAARAGEHGKGFAVVAEEVRTLAARSATAAKETTDMIDNSLSKVDVGTKIAAETAAALSKIVSGVTNTVDIVATIAEASAQQSTAIAQIDNGVEQISKVTQTNTATAEESASASEEMAGQAQMLQGMINEFNLKGQKSIKGNNAATRSIAPPPVSKQDDIIISLDDDFGKY